MPNANTFSILSTRAPLVEVTRLGPVLDLREGLTVPDGAVTTSPVDTAGASVRRWRVDAAPTEQTAVVVIDSPFGAFVEVHRRLPVSPSRVERYLSVDQWPKVHTRLKHHAPWIVDLWHLFADPSERVWSAVNEGDSGQAVARGGDLVVVDFVRLSSS
jgi:hypothetical protein